MTKPCPLARPSLAALLVAVMLSGCGWNTRQPPTTSLDQANPRPPQTDVLVRDDLTNGKLVFYGPPILAPQGPDIGRDGHRLRSEVDKQTGAVTHWIDLRVHWVGSGIDYWVAAEARRSGRDERADSSWVEHDRSNASFEKPRTHDSKSTLTEADKSPVPLKLGVPHLAVGTCARVLWIGCDHDEEITAILPEDLLTRAGDTDLRVRFRMNHGRTYVGVVTAEQINAQLARIERWRRVGG
ncbi:exported hypothetical protein [Magnetospirillum sp. LM-5]|uniref:hypothetical protein n=1 Tax=Magnetospirillum sp. LM-5 TaxID=2681466 RepID=UPI0013846272|nr:hypothetical protein [Magnetospirillum sp. LM-5]CAA7617758.1 exported hypothetical protein [Magnetospirillum sp. LM-5]